MPKSIARGASKTPDDAIWWQRWDGQELRQRSRDGRYHDVAEKDEQKILFRQ